MIDIVIVTDRDLAGLNRLGEHPSLARELERAVVVSAEAVPSDVVTMRSRVLYTDETLKSRRAVVIVYPWEADSSDARVSVLSPVGTALLGLSVGQSIEWDFPDSRRHRLRVEDVIQKSSHVAAQ